MKVALRNEFVLFIGLAVVLFALLALNEVWALPAPFRLLRLLLGLWFILFLPGYSIQTALFTRPDELDLTERVALSFGLSIALVPLIAFLLDSLGPGIHLWGIVTAEAALSGVFILLSGVRRWALGLGDHYVVDLQITPRTWWAAQDRVNRTIYAVLALAVGIALVSGLAVTLSTKPSSHFTEFYVLGHDNLAERYPQTLVLGETVSVRIGITNREGETTAYQVEVYQGDEMIGHLATVQLKQGVTFETEINIVPVQASENAPILFTLYRDHDLTPYRSLRLWTTIEPPDS